MSRYVALLQGISVGGNNLIKMIALKTCFQELGFADVQRSGAQSQAIATDRRWRAPRRASAPSRPARYRYDVIYLVPPLSASAALKGLPLNPEADQAPAGAGVLYFWRLISLASRSRLGKATSDSSRRARQACASTSIPPAASSRQKQMS